MRCILWGVFLQRDAGTFFSQPVGPTSSIAFDTDLSREVVPTNSQPVLSHPPLILRDTVHGMRGAGIEEKFCDVS
jgi:hypothetical protein